MLRRRFPQEAALAWLGACVATLASCEPLPSGQNGVLRVAEFVSLSPDRFNSSGYTPAAPLAVGASARIQVRGNFSVGSFVLGVSDASIVRLTAGGIEAVGPGTTSLLAIRPGGDVLPWAPLLVPSLNGVADRVQITTAHVAGFHLVRHCEDGSVLRAHAFRYVRRPRVGRTTTLVRIPLAVEAVTESGIALQLGDAAARCDPGDREPFVNLSAERNDLRCSALGVEGEIAIAAAAVPDGTVLQFESITSGRTRAELHVTVGTLRLPCDFVFVPLAWTRDDGGVLSEMHGCRDARECHVEGDRPPDRIIVTIPGTSTSAVAMVGP